MHVFQETARNVFRSERNLHDTISFAPAEISSPDPADNNARFPYI